MIEFTQEPFAIVEENQQLITEHWNEVVQDSRKLEVAWDWFYKTEALGALKVFVARDAGEVIGYAVFVLQWHLHSASVLTAHNDAVFLRKDRRAGGTGVRLIAFCDKELEKLKVGMIYWHIKPAINFGRVLQKYGYTLHEEVWVRLIGV